MPVKYAMNAKDNAVTIIGPMAKPSNPSVRFTEFAHPTITIEANK